VNGAVTHSDQEKVVMGRMWSKS